MPLEIAGPLGCGILTGAGAVINALEVKSGQSIVVVGSGSVGLSAIMAAASVGAGPIIAVDLHPARLELAKELGATHVIDAGNADVVAAVAAILPPGVDFALDCTGLPRVIEQCVQMLAPRGTCGIVGASTHDAKITLDVVPFMSSGRKLRGIVEGDSDPKLFIPQLVALYRDGKFPFDKLITFYPFERINDAFQDSELGKVVKPVLLFDR
jgi:aryl-alcohol dehydrogenase